MQPKIFVTRRIPEAGLERIRAAGDCSVWPDRMPPTPEQLIENARGCDGVLTLLSDRIDADFFDAVGPQLKVVSNFAVGYNNIDVQEAADRGITVGNTPGVLTDSTADLAAALLLAASRCVRSGLNNVDSGDWKTWEPTGFIGQDLSGRTLGILGMGRIGQATARRFRFGWNMNILYASRSPKPEAEQELGAVRTSTEELFRRSDFVSVHTDLNPETRHIVNARTLALMQPHAVLINTARGGIVDEAALFSALSSGAIFAAGLDVTDPEPPAADNPLLSLDNCIVLPHIASGTTSSRNAMAEIAADNLLAGLEGRPLRHAVTP